MNSLELTDKQNQLFNEVRSIMANAQKEERFLTDEEQEQYDKIKAQIAELEAQKVDLEKKLNEDDEQTETNNKETDKENRNMAQFNLIKAINDVVNNRKLDEATMAVNAQGVNEMRFAGQNYAGQIVIPSVYEQRDGVAGVVAKTATHGKEAIATDTLEILPPLYENLVLAKAGATFMTGLTGNVEIPLYTGSAVGWKGEIETASKGDGTFSSVPLSPKRLTAYIDVSKQFLNQTSPSAEQMLKNDIVNAISQKLEATILGDGAGSTDVPAGIFNGVTAETTATDYAKIVDMEKAIETAKVSGDIKFIVSPASKAELKKTKIDTGSGRFVMDGSEMIGYDVLSTGNVTGKGVALGNFSDLVIAQWGGIDLTVDPYTQAANGMIRIVVNAYFDAKLRNNDAIKRIILK